MKKLMAAAAASLMLAGSLAACSGNTVEAPAQSQEQSQAPAKAPSATPKSDGSAKFGGAVTFPNKVKVSVSQPKAVPAGQYAFGAVQGKITVFTITVTNGSDQPVNGALMGVPRVTYGASGTQAKLATNETIGGEFLGNILPGEKQSVQVGYGVPPAEVASMRVEVMSANLADTPAVFKGQ